MFVLFSVAVIFELTLLIKKKKTLTNNKTSNPYNLEFKKEQNYFTWVKVNVCEVSGNLVHELDQSLVSVLCGYLGNHGKDGHQGNCICLTTEQL